MTIPDVVALVTAVTALATAVTALLHSILTRSKPTSSDDTPAKPRVM